MDWANLAANSLWIGALALALATLSVASWQASLAHQKLSAALALPGPKIALTLAVVLFCSGLAATSRTQWEVGAWIILGLSFLAQRLLAGRGRHGGPETNHPGG